MTAAHIIFNRRTALLLFLICALGNKVLIAQSASSWTIGGDNGIPWAAAAQRWIALDDSTHPGAIQPFEIPPGHSVTRELIRSGIATTQRNLFGYRWSLHKGPRQIEADTLEVGWHPRMWTGGRANTSAAEVMRGLVDGDVLTAAFTHNARADNRPNGVRYITFDLGVSVPIDSIVFFPPQTGLTSDNQRQRELFARAYEVSRTNTPTEWLIFEDETTSTGSSGYHALDEILGSTFANNTSIVVLTPQLDFTRFLRFKFGEVTTTTMIAEIELFGHGYPEEARYISELHSFGEAVSLGQVTWKFTKFRQSLSGEIFEDPTAPVKLELQTRSGFDPNPNTFFIFDELGRLLEVDEKTFFDAPRVTEPFSEGVAGFRALRGDDTANWNNWSVNYQQSGDEIRSSDGGEFFQFRFKINSTDPLAFGRLDSLSFEISPLLADSVLAELSLDTQEENVQSGILEVPLGIDQLYAYDIRTVAGTTNRTGFDGIKLYVPASAQFVNLEIDGVVASENTDFSFTQKDNHFRFIFAETFTANKAFRIRFRSAIFQSSVFLEGQIFNSSSSFMLPQSIEAGDARADVYSNTIQIVANDNYFTLIGNIESASQIITPNDDKVNDATSISFDLFGLNGGRLTVAIYDLAGQQVNTLLATEALAGPYAPIWDGTDQGRKRVPPGLYLVRIEVDVDEGNFTTVQPIAVAY